MRIPKPQLAYICRLHEIGSHVLLDQSYVKPEHIHHWVGADYAADNKVVLITKILLSPSKWNEVFKPPD